MSRATRASPQLHLVFPATEPGQVLDVSSWESNMDSGKSPPNQRFHRNITYKWFIFQHVMFDYIPEGSTRNWSCWSCDRSSFLGIHWDAHLTGWVTLPTQSYAILIHIMCFTTGPVVGVLKQCSSYWVDFAGNLKQYLQQHMDLAKNKHLVVFRDHSFHHDHGGW